jgi:hypothetical protein
MKKQARKILYETLKKEGWHLALFPNGSITYETNSALIDTVLDGMIEFSNKQSQHKTDCLKLAGKLALNAELVVNSNVKNLSNNIQKLENSLDEYNNKIFNNHE